MLVNRKIGKALYTSLAAVALLGAGAVIGTTVSGTSAQTVNAATVKENSDGAYVASDGWYFWDQDAAEQYAKGSKDEDVLNSRNALITVVFKDASCKVYESESNDSTQYEEIDGDSFDYFTSIPFGYKSTNVSSGFTYNDKTGTLAGKITQPKMTITITIARDNSIEIPTANADGMYVASDGWYFYNEKSWWAYQQNQNDEDALTDRAGHVTLKVVDTTGRTFVSTDYENEEYQNPDYLNENVTIPFGYKMKSLTKGFELSSYGDDIDGKLTKPNTDIVLTITKDSSQLKTKTANKTALAAAIDDSYNYQASQYTYASYNKMTTLRDTIQLNASNLSSQVVVDKQTSDLQSAIKALVKRTPSSTPVDKTALKVASTRAQDAVMAIQNPDPNTYDDLLWDISEVNAVMDDPDAMQSEVDTALTHVNDGIKNLLTYDSKHAYGETEVTLNIDGDTYKDYYVKGLAGTTYDVAKDVPAGYKVSGNSTFKFTDRFKHLGSGDSAGQFYLDEADFKLVPSKSTAAKNDQGPAVSYKKYVTVTKKGYTVWGNFDWTKKKTNTTSLYNKTYLAKVKYNHSNGSTYLSLYDGSKWLGYVNAAATKVSAKQQGNAISANKYVTLTSKNYTVWSGFDFKKVKHYSKNYYQKTYHVKTIYNHASGAVYYSLYDSKGKWFGYINAAATKTASGAQGIAISTNKYVTLTSKNYTIWSSFDFKKVKHYSKNYFNKTYQAKTIYNHASGAVYYSLYDNNGKWFGYINASGTKQASGDQGIAITYNKTVTVKRSGYTIWGDFFAKKRGTTTDYVGKKLTAKVAYNHINGSQYLSLYSGSKWIGYVNASVVK